VLYLANLVALEEWYKNVRQPFFARQEMGRLVYEGALEVLDAAKQERTKRLLAMAQKVPAGTEGARQWRERAAEVCGHFAAGPERSAVAGEAFAAEAVALASGRAGGGYVDTIQALPQDVVARGVNWLDQTVDALLDQARTLLPALEL
jgi:hypothetical protein